MAVAKVSMSFVLLILGVSFASAPQEPGVRLTVSSVRPQENSISATGVVRYGVTKEDVARIQKSVPNIATAVPIRELEVTASKSERKSTARLVGTTSEFSRITAIRLERGRFLVERDNTHRDNVIVLGSQLAKTLFPGKDAIGQSVKLSGDSMRSKGLYSVVGQLAAAKTLAERQLAGSAFIPIATMRGRLGDVVIRRDRGAFIAEQYELSRLELILQKPESRLQTKNTVTEIMARTHEQSDYEVKVVAFADEPEPPSNPNPSRQNKSETILESGTLESAKSLTLACPLVGESSIVRVVPEGTVAKKGDVLVQLENNGIKARVAKSRVELIATERRVSATQAEIEVAKLEAESAAKTGKLQIEAAELEREQYFGAGGQQAVEAAALKREIAGAEAAMQAARLAIEIAEKGDTRNPLNILEARLKETQAKSLRDNAQDGLRLLNGPTKALRNKVFELQIEKAKIGQQRQNALTKRQLAELQSDLAVARLEFDTAKDQHEQLIDQLAASSVRAPIDGVVIYATTSNRRTSSPQLIRSGAVVRERQALVKVTDVEQLQVRVRVHESKIRRIRVGQKCMLVFDALPGQRTSGVVRTVANVPVPGAWPNTDLKEYEVVVALEKSDRKLRLGMTCEARFLIDE